MLSINCKPDERATNKLKIKIHRGEATKSRSPYNPTYGSKISSTTTNNDERVSNYDTSYSATFANRGDLVTPYSYIQDEKHDFFEQRLEILKLKINNIMLDKLLVYISLEYLLNCNPDPILLKDIYHNLDTTNESLIIGNKLYLYFLQNKNELSEYIRLNQIDLDSQISHCCQWKLSQIFSLHHTNHSMQRQMKTIKHKYNDSQSQLKKIHNELKQLKQEMIKVQQQNLPSQIPITRTIDTSETQLSREICIIPSLYTQSQPAPHTQHKKHAKRHKKDKIHKKKSLSIEKKALLAWRQYTDRLMYIKQRYPTEYIDRNKGWEKWSELLNKTEESGKISTNLNLCVKNLWQYIDFARMSLGRYYGWIKHKYNHKWIKKYVVLMDFNLFLFDKKTQAKCIKETLSFKHELLSIASIQNVILSVKENKNCNEFVLQLNGDNNWIQFKCNDRQERENWMDEINYQIKCMQDLLKIPFIKLKPANPDKTIWLPIPVKIGHKN